MSDGIRLVSCHCGIEWPLMQAFYDKAYTGSVPSVPEQATSACLVHGIFRDVGRAVFFVFLLRWAEYLSLKA